MSDKVRIPPAFRCPYCEPEPVSYAGVVISRVCGECQREIEIDATEQEITKGVTK